MPVLKADTYVLIVGAGPVGVTLQLLLSRMGVPCLLAERNIHPRSHPRSHYVSNRSTEVWRQLGHLDKVVECITEPLKFWASMRYCRHIADPHLNLFGTVNHFRGHYTYGDTYHEELSPARITNIAQHKLLLLLKAASLTRSPVYPDTSDERYIAWLRDHYDQVMRTSTFDDAKRAKLRALRGPTIFPDGFDSVKRTLDQRCGVPFVDGGLMFERFINEDMSKGVVSELTCQRRKVKVHVNSAFVVGADGVHSRVRRFLDRRNPDKQSQVQDTSLLRDVMSVYFTSDELGQLVKASPAMLYFIFSRCVSVLTCQGGSPAEFVVQIPFFSEMEDSSGYDVAKCTACINEFVGTTLSDLRVVITQSIKRWRATTEIAPSFVDPESYRVMVAGDSAHIVTPAGGQGMNMGVADSYNLAWRIGRSFYQRVLRGGPGTSAADVINAEMTHEEKRSMADYSRERLAVAEVGDSYGLI
uniref:FAD binding domain containing protein n=1 Tax=Babesia bovis TaxID=5865 RepID=A7AX52_BABBO|eukprot:XP_001608693.1 FAD binding domain containing protein [Babesia bovis T2Bo]